MALETPPRAWGRHRQSVWQSSERRNTPTGVGKTPAAFHHALEDGKHPHGRGEDDFSAVEPRIATETPPRAWGRRICVPWLAFLKRNTPTGVGKTLPAAPRSPACQKHPHGRGEDGEFAAPSKVCEETPPRAWGRPEPPQSRKARRGNTPTGVGKTYIKPVRSDDPKKHPHGRGEDLKTTALRARLWETPPRAWGRLTADPLTLCRFGNTPTGVGKT